MNDYKYVYNQAVSDYAGLFVRGLDSTIAVNKLITILPNKVLIAITHRSNNQISRLKKGTAVLKQPDAQKIYEFYQRISSLPLTDQDGNYVTIQFQNASPLYADKELQTLADQLQTLKTKLSDDIQDVIDTSAETLTSTLPSSSLLDKHQYSPITNKNDNHSPEKTETNADMQMRRVSGFQDNQMDQWQSLTKQEKYLMEFLGLISVAQLDNTQSLFRSSMVEQPSQFWLLYFANSNDNNRKLREQYTSQAIELNHKPLVAPEKIDSWAKKFSKYLRLHRNDYANDADDSLVRSIMN